MDFLLSLLVVIAVVIGLCMVILFVKFIRFDQQYLPRHIETPPHKSAKEILEDLKYQEELNRDYVLVSEYWYMGEKIEDLTPEQRKSPMLLHHTYYKRKK